MPRTEIGDPALLPIVVEQTMSDKEASAAAGSRAVVKNCTVDTVVAAILFVVGAVVVFEARRLGASWTSDGPGAGYFPFYIGLIVCVSALGVIYQARAPKTRDEDTFVDREQLGRVLSVLRRDFHEHLSEYLNDPAAARKLIAAGES